MFVFVWDVVRLAWAVWLMERYSTLSSTVARCRARYGQHHRLGVISHLRAIPCSVAELLWNRWPVEVDTEPVSPTPTRRSGGCGCEED